MAAIDMLMVALTVGGPLAAVIVPLAIAGSHRREGVTILAAVIAAIAIAVELQMILGRAPPTGVTLLPQPGLPAFPSGSAAGLFAGATCLALCFRRYAGWAFGFALLVSISRVWVGHHFVTDVAAGAIGGAAVGAVAYGIFYREIDSARPRWAWLLWLQFALIAFATFGAYLGLTRFEVLKLPGADKVGHFVLYGLLGFFLAGWFARHSVRALAILAVVAIVEEVLQQLSPMRSFDLVDLVATLAGVAVGGLVSIRLLRRSALDNSPT